MDTSNRRAHRVRQPRDREKAAEHSRRYRERKLAQYVAEHGAMPQCECGCGTEVGMAADGKPYRFKNGHRMRMPDRIEALRIHSRERWDDRNSIDRDVFFTKLNELRVAKGMTWPELCEKIGTTNDTLQGMRYSKKRRRVSKRWATAVLQRLASQAATPTRAQRERWAKLARADREIEALGRQ